MASNTGAYFEGMQYASQGVQPVNFGELATGFAKIVEDKRKEEKQDQLRRENTQMEMSKLFGEEIYSAFDGTGLQDVDVVTSKIKDSIVARANVLNSLFEKGQLTAPQMMQEMQKLNAQSKKISSFASSSAEAFSKIQGNTNSSAATDFLVQKANQLFKEATPVMDANGNISFLSKDGDVITNNPVNELEKLLQNRERFDVSGLAETIVKTQGQIRQKFEDGKVVKSAGEVGESQKQYIGNIVNAMDQEDLFDVANQAGIKVQMDPNSVFNIVNKDEVRSQVQKYLEDYTRSAFEAKTTVDEVAGKQLSMQLNQDYRAAQKFKQENQGAVVNVIGTEEEGQEIQVFPPAGKTVTVDSVVLDGKTFSRANVGRYVVDKNGNHKATISYKTVIDVPKAVGAGTEKKEVFVTEDLTIEDPATINQIRAQFKMEPIKEVSLSKKRKAY